MVAFDSEETPHQHKDLGRAIVNLRSHKIAIIVSGMAVQNLRHYRINPEVPRPTPCTKTFNGALKDAVTSLPAEHEQRMAELLGQPDARQPHPTIGHLLPIFVGAGVAGDKFIACRQGSIQVW